MSISKDAKGREISERTIGDWVKGADVEAARAQALLIDARKELTRLRRENRRLREKLQIQRRAVTFLNRRSQQIRAELAASEIDRWDALFETGSAGLRAHATPERREARARRSPGMLRPVQAQSPVGPWRPLAEITALVLASWAVLMGIGYGLARVIVSGWL